MLYQILLDAPRSNYDPIQNPGPHADGILGSTNVKYVDSVTSHLKELSLNHSAGGPNLSVSSNPTQLEDVQSVKLSTYPNGNQQLGRNNKNEHNNNRKGG